MPIEIAPGLKVETVADIIGDHGEASAAPTPLVSPPQPEGSPPFPEPGIYFGMPDAHYHAIYACSASGLKSLSCSAMNHWANSVLNKNRPPDDEKKMLGKTLGRAYHARICEGVEAYLSRYFVALDQSEFSADLVVTIDDIRKAIEALDGKPKGSKKEPLICQLLDLDPNAFVWDRIVADHAEENIGKIAISREAHNRIEIAAKMIAASPYLKDLFLQGQAEVSLFWYDAKTGIPMKARIDYLKMNAFIDLKSFANKMSKPVQRAVDNAISNEKHYLPVVVYHEGIEAVKRLVRETKGRCVFGWVDGLDDFPSGTPYWSNPKEEFNQWAWQWAHQPSCEALYIYQQTGIAPVTIPRLMPKGSTYVVNEGAVHWLMRKWRRYVETFGEDPWIDDEPITRTVDENLQWSATDYGDTE